MPLSILNNTVFSTNLSVLEYEYPELARRVKKYVEHAGPADFDAVGSDESTGLSHDVSSVIAQHNFVVMLGIGSISYLQTVAKILPRYAQMIVIEKNIGAFVSVIVHCDISKLLEGWHVKFIVDVDCNDFNRYLNQYYFQIDSLLLLKPSGSVEYDEEYYSYVERQLSLLTSNRCSSQIKSKTYTFLILIGSKGTGWPYILQDIIAGFHALGHSAYTYCLDAGYDIGKFTQLIEVVKPDFIFLLDAIGLVPEILEKTGVPYVSWFFDNPFIWLKKHHISDNYYTIVWDKTYVHDLLELGFKHVTYVPLGANPAVFCPHNSSELPISFVGSSLLDEPPLAFDSEAKKKFIQLVSRLICKIPWKPVWKILDELTSQTGVSLQLDEPERKHEFEVFVQSFARSEYRRDIIRHLLEFSPYLYGDKGWIKLIHNGNGVYNGRINNRLGLPVVYSSSSININITVPQIRNSFSHRAFEIPACKGFLLSDYRPEAETFFELDTEIVCFRSTMDLKEKVRFYLANPAERYRIAQNGYNRVLAEHTYVHRLGKIISWLCGRVV